MNRAGWFRALTLAAFLAAAASVARAEFATGATVTEVSGTYTSYVTDDGSKINAADGVYVFDKQTNTGQSSVVQVDASFTAGQVRTQIILYTGTVANAYLYGVAFIDSSTSEFATWTASNPATEGALTTSSGNLFTFDQSGSGTYGLSLSSGFSTYDTITLFFIYKNNNDRLQFDALANPEPLSFGLFAFGAAGLAYGAKRRRRKSGKPGRSAAQPA